MKGVASFLSGVSGCIKTHEIQQMIISIWHQRRKLPSVLWHCWLGNRKDINQ